MEFAATLCLIGGQLPGPVAAGEKQPASDAAPVNVMQCGAVGDGRADDAPGIQRALDRGAAVVIIPAGQYRVGQTLRIGSGTTLKADPQAVIRLADGAGNHVSQFLLSNRNPGNGNQRITVEGGIWDGNNEHNRRGRDGDLFGYTGTAINFTNVKHLVVRNLTVRDPEAFSVRLGEVEDFLVEDIVLDHRVVRPNQDGIHVGGFSERGVIRRIRALAPNTPNDDMVALNADDDVERVLNLGMRRGPIRNVLVEDLQAQGAYNFVRILSAGAPVEHITVRRVTGSCRFYAVNLNSWRFPPGTGDIRNVRLEQFRVAKTVMNPWAPSLIHVQLNVQDLVIRDFDRVACLAAESATTLTLANGRENAIRLNGGPVQMVRDFTIPAGSIHALDLNISAPR
jgi:polygalacturonase